MQKLINKKNSNRFLLTISVYKNRFSIQVVLNISHRLLKFRSLNFDVDKGLKFNNRAWPLKFWKVTMKDVKDTESVCV